MIRAEQPHLDNRAGKLHSDYTNWRAFLATIPLVEEKRGFRRYCHSNEHYIVNPNGFVLRFVGYAGLNAFQKFTCHSKRGRYAP